MPVTPCEVAGKPGYRWGESGRCFLYTAGNARSRARARRKAAAQGRAIAARADAKARRQKAATMKPPDRLEKMYRKRLLRRVRMMAEALKDKLEPILDELGPGINQRANEQEAAKSAPKASGSSAVLARMRGDASASEAAAAAARILREAIRQVGVTFTEAFFPDPADLLQLARVTDDFATNQSRKAIETVSAIPVPATTGELSSMHLAWARENARLITSIDAKFFREVADLTANAVLEGKSTRSVAKAIQERTQATRSRARLIARNEIGNINAQINQARQTSLGVTEYKWSTVGDDLVRPEHAAREGKTFSWADPPSDGHPGESVNCRCSATPVIP